MTDLSLVFVSLSFFASAVLWYRARIREIEQTDAKRVAEFRQEIEQAKAHALAALEVAERQDGQVKKLASEWHDTFESTKAGWSKQLENHTKELSTKFGLLNSNGFARR